MSSKDMNSLGSRSDPMNSTDELPPADSSLIDLKAAEDEICKILKISSDTLQELQNMPVCDIKRMEMFSTSLYTTLESIRERLARQSKKIFCTDQLLVGGSSDASNSTTGSSNDHTPKDHIDSAMTQLNAELEDDKLSENGIS